MVYRALIKDVPMFNQSVSSSRDAPNVIGKIDEILGPVSHFLFTVTPVPGVDPSSVKAGSKVYIDKAFVLPLVIFTNPLKNTGPKRLGGGVAGRKFGGPGGQRPPQGNFNRGPGGPQGGQRNFQPRPGNQNWQRNPVQRRS